MTGTTPGGTGIDTWIFDLDNTLYPAESNLFHQIDRRMASFIEETLDCCADSARRLQKGYYVSHGTTLAGLMIEHGVKPEDFLDYVHDIDLGPLTPDPALGEAIDRLEGKRYIFTNGSVKHAENVAGHLGILDHFHGIFDIAAGEYRPKPYPEPYRLFLDRFGVDPERAAFFEDMEANLRVPHEKGMTTVLVQSDAKWLDDEPAEKRPARPGQAFPHVHDTTTDLTGYLRTRMSTGFPGRPHPKGGQE